MGACYKRALMPPGAPTLPRWAVVVLAALCAFVGAYTLYRGAVVTLEYFDGYQFLGTTRRLAGDRTIGEFTLMRPPLLALLDLPAFWLAQRGATANLGYTLFPHLTAALLALFSAWTLFYVYTAALEWRLALLGGTLFVTSRMFLRYGSLTMSDLLSMAFGALAVGLHVRSMNRPTWTRDVLVGVAIGLGATAKYPLLLTGGVVALSEALVAWKRRRLPVRRLIGLATSGLSSAVTLVALLALAYGLGRGAKQLGGLVQAIRVGFTAGTAAVRALAGETRWDNAVMIAATTAWPILVLAVVGLVVLVKDREERDLPFLSWLLGLGGILIATIGHNEVRYLLPAVPALLYFAVRGAEALLRRAPTPAAVGAGVVALALACCWGGARQVRADADPAFRADTARRATLALHQLRRPGGHLRWIGGFSCIYPATRVELPRDEFFDAFNFHGPQMLYFGEPANPIPSLLFADDGDAVVDAGPNCNGLALPAAPPRPWAVQGVRRRPLVAQGLTFTTPEKDVALSVFGGTAGVFLRVTATPPAPTGTQRLLVVRDPGARLVGPVPLEVGGQVALGGHDVGAVQGIDLIELTTVTIPVR
jgi:hypothetical protein